MFDEATCWNAKVKGALELVRHDLAMSHQQVGEGGDMSQSSSIECSGQAQALQGGILAHSISLLVGGEVVSPGNKAASSSPLGFLDSR